MTLRFDTCANSTDCTYKLYWFFCGKSNFDFTFSRCYI